MTSEYSASKRLLPFPLRNSLAINNTTEDDGDCDPSSFVWPDDSDERVVVTFDLSLNEYNVLASAIEVGADIAYGEDAIRVIWLWLRNMRCEAQMPCNCCPPNISLSDRMASMQYISETTSIYNTTYNTWNNAGQTIASIAPDLDADTGVPADIDKLVCFAMGLFLETALGMAREIKAQNTQSEQDLTRDIGIALGALSAAGAAGIAVGGTAAAFVGFFGGPWLVLGLALGAVGAAVGGIVQNVPDTALNNQAAIQNVLCTMRTNTVDQPFTQAALAAMFDIPNIPVNSDEARIVEAILPFAENQNIYVQLLSAMQTLYNTVDIDDLPPCEFCAPSEPVSIFLPAGRPGGSFTKLGNVYTFTSGTDDGVHRIAWQYAGLCATLTSISYSVSPDGGSIFQNWTYPCGENPAVNGYNVGYDVGLAVSGQDYAGVIVRHSSVFTMTVTLNDV